MTLLSLTILSQTHTPSYIVIEKNRPGGGVAAIFKSTLKLKKIEKYKEERSAFELLESDFGHNNKSFKVAIVYRPPPSRKNTATARQFLEDVRTLYY